MKILNPIEQTQNKQSNNSQFILELQNHLSNSIKNPPLVLDRYEGNYAICENRNTGKILEIPKSYISKRAKDGDILKFRHGIYQINFKETRKQKEIMKKLINNLKNN